MEAPVLATERLMMRGHTKGDLDDCTALWSDPDVTRFIGGKPSTREEVWSRILRYVGHWAVNDFGFWAVVERSSGRFVGDVGFADFKRDIVPSFEGTPEMGWVLAPWAHGRGFATEAVRAALVWGDAHFGGARTVCLIDVGNARSIRLAEKCGFHESTRTTYKGSAAIVFYR